MVIIVTFCGHSEIAQPDNARSLLYSVVESLILDGADILYFGGYGASLAATVLQN